MKQYTYMMLKPDAFVDHKNQRVLEILAQHQLHVEKSQVVQVDIDVMKIYWNIIITLLTKRERILIFLQDYLILSILMVLTILCLGK